MDPWKLSKGLSFDNSNLFKFQAVHHAQNGLLDCDILERISG